MNTYIFLQLSRKGPPRLEGTVRASTPEEAIRLNNYFPFDMEEDFIDNPCLSTPEERVEVVRTYYGLIPGKSAYDAGNGPDGYGTTLVEVSMEGHETKLYPAN